MSEVTATFTKEQSNAAAVAAINLLKQDVKRIAETLGKGMDKVEKSKLGLEETIKAQIDVAKEHGLTASMLYKGTKDSPSIMWQLFMDTIAKYSSVSTASRDNYMSRIRKYLDGKSEFDLFDRAGQKAAAEKRAARQPSTPSKEESEEVDTAKLTVQESGSPKNKAVQRGVEEKLIGLPAFHMFCEAWLAANPVGTISAKYRDMIVSLDTEIADVIAVKK